MPDNSPHALHLIVELYAGEYGLEGLDAFEREVLPIIQNHGGKLLHALRPEAHGDNGIPDEIHHLVFPDEQAFDNYCSDPRTNALTERRRQIIAHSRILRISHCIDYTT